MGTKRGGTDRTRKGFTLLEVLVAVALSSMIMVALFGLFGSVADVASSVKQQETASYGIRVFESILFDDLRSVHAARSPAFRFMGKHEAAFGDDGRFLEFCTSASLTNIAEGTSFSLQRVGYSLRDEESSRVLYRREKAHCGLTGKWQWVEVPVLRDVRRLEVEYFDPARKVYVSEWSNGNTRYPSSLKVRIALADTAEHVLVFGLSTMAREYRIESGQPR